MLVTYQVGPVLPSLTYLSICFNRLIEQVGLSCFALLISGTSLPTLI